MNLIVNTKNRQYTSPLREEQAQSTRDRILDATSRLLARGLAGLSIPAIAREAGVSVPTVYRNFGTKQGLFEAIYPYAIRRARTGELKPPTSIEDFRDGVRIVFERFESFDELDRAAVASHGAEEVRHANIEARLATAREVADTIAPELSADDRERLARLGILLTMSASARMLREHLGLSLDEAVADVDWTIRAVIAGRMAKEGGR
jgi:AcrR family transcriptional regulator